MNEQPIVIVEDNTEDCEFLTESLNVVGVTNPLRCFDNAIAALSYLREANEIPFVIISDIKMPLMNGIEFRRSIVDDEKLNKQNIPFIFLSMLPPSMYAKEVKKLAVQGHFKKPADFTDMVHLTRSIIESLNRVGAMTK